MVANYVSGNIISYPLTLDGRLGGGQSAISFEGSGPTDRQTSPHAHFIAPLKGDRIVTADLGSDSIRIHSFQTGQLKPADISIPMSPGAGPRHIAVHPNNDKFYVVNELNATIAVIESDFNGSYRIVQTISTIPDKQKGGGDCAAIKITANGQYLYVSNRGSWNNIGMYRIEENGHLGLLGHQSTFGEIPRDFSISPGDGFLVVANQNSNSLVSYRIDEYTGYLSDPIILNDVPTPVCVQFL